MSWIIIGLTQSKEGIDELCPVTKKNAGGIPVMREFESFENARAWLDSAMGKKDVPALIFDTDEL